MKMRLTRHFGRNAVAYIALFIALGGTSYAVPPLITGADIEDNSVTSVDIADQSLTGRDILDGSITDLDVADDSLTGSDLDESTLAKVPDADALDGLDSTGFLGVNAKAADADRLDGLDSSAFVKGIGKVYAASAEFTVNHPKQVVTDSGIAFEAECRSAWFQTKQVGSVWIRIRNESSTPIRWWQTSDASGDAYPWVQPRYGTIDPAQAGVYTSSIGGPVTAQIEVQASLAVLTANISGTVAAVIDDKPTCTVAIQVIESAPAGAAG
jgi:hypothetical protein